MRAAAMAWPVETSKPEPEPAVLMNTRWPASYIQRACAAMAWPSIVPKGSDFVGGVHNVARITRIPAGGSFFIVAPNLEGVPVAHDCSLVRPDGAGSASPAHCA